MPLGTEVDLGPNHIVLDGDPKKGGTTHPILAHVLWPNGCMDQDATWYGIGLGPGDIVLDEDLAPLKGGTTPSNFSTHVYCGQTAG